MCRVQLLHDGTGTEAIFRVLVEWTNPCDLVVDWVGGPFSLLLTSEVCMSAHSVCT
jgi:hypothetical protein